jgi:hypothetical protein
MFVIIIQKMESLGEHPRDQEQKNPLVRENPKEILNGI